MRDIAVLRGRRALRPRVDGLEGRLLLYATLGARWAHASGATPSTVTVNAPAMRRCSAAGPLIGARR